MDSDFLACALPENPRKDRRLLLLTRLVNRGKVRVWLRSQVLLFLILHFNPSIPFNYLVDQACVHHFSLLLLLVVSLFFYAKDSKYLHAFHPPQGMDPGMEKGWDGGKIQRTTD